MPRFIAVHPGSFKEEDLAGLAQRRGEMPAGVTWLCTWCAASDPVTYCDWEAPDAASVVGVLEKFGVKVIGVELDAIERGEDRIIFKETMNRLGIEIPKSTAVYSVEDAEKVAADLGYPVVVRPAYTMGGTGGGLVYNVEELRTVASRGISASLIGQVLIEIGRAHV